MKAVALQASADFGQTGQYIARLTGRNSKFTFEREFVGRKFGKRNEGTSADLDELGVYECRDSTRKGKVDRYRLIVLWNGELKVIKSDKSDAMEICREIDNGRAFRSIVAVSEDTDGSLVYEIHSAEQAALAAALAAPAVSVDTSIVEVSEAVAGCVELLGRLPADALEQAIARIREVLQVKS